MADKTLEILWFKKIPKLQTLTMALLLVPDSMKKEKKKHFRAFPQNAEALGSWATATEDHISFHACQQRTGILPYSEHRFTETG